MTEETKEVKEEVEEAAKVEVNFIYPFLILTVPTYTENIFT